MSKTFKPMDETHVKGQISIENIERILCDAKGGVRDLGIQIAPDGRVWICVDGMAFIRFRPTIKE